MKRSKVHGFILFSLGAWFEEANRRIKDKPLRITISKRIFIDLVQNAGMAKKQERALYKNLEVLEKRRLISYKNKELALTKRGQKLYDNIKKDMGFYTNVLEKLVTKSPTSYTTRKLQTTLK